LVCSFDERIKDLENILKYYDQLVSNRKSLDNEISKKSTELKELKTSLNYGLEKTRFLTKLFTEIKAQILTEQRLLTSEIKLNNSLNSKREALRAQTENKKLTNSMLMSGIVFLAAKSYNFINLFFLIDVAELKNKSSRIEISLDDSLINKKLKFKTCLCIDYSMKIKIYDCYFKKRDKRL
jgi:hypothetical protein